MKVVIQTAMHGRQSTVKYCLDKMRGLDVEFVYGYTDKADRNFLVKELASFKDYTVYSSCNSPLWMKFQTGVEILRSMDFDLLICLGSDDYIDQSFLDFVIDKAKTYDFIGFKDIYFESSGNKYYWKGYSNHRVGEPCGAGKCYTKKALELMDYKLFDNSKDRGLDHHAWTQTQRLVKSRLVESIKEQSLNLTDVKDGKGLTPLYLLSDNLTSISTQ